MTTLLIIALAVWFIFSTTATGIRIGSMNACTDPMIKNPVFAVLTYVSGCFFILLILGCVINGGPSF